MVVMSGTRKPNWTGNQNCLQRVLQIVFRDSPGDVGGARVIVVVEPVHRDWSFATRFHTVLIHVVVTASVGLTRMAPGILGYTDEVRSRHPVNAARSRA